MHKKQVLRDKGILVDKQNSPGVRPHRSLKLEIKIKREKDRVSQIKERLSEIKYKKNVALKGPNVREINHI